MKTATTTLFVGVLALLALGVVMLLSAGAAQAEAKYFTRQLLWAAVGLGVCVLAWTVDYRLLKRHWLIPWGLWSGAVGLLVLVLVAGERRHGAARWLTVGGCSVQPSELAKLALIILLAWWGERRAKRLERRASNLLWGLLLPGVFIGVPLALIFKEPDWGTTILLAAVSGLMLFLAGTRWYYLLPPAALGAYLVSQMIIHDPVRGDRWDAYLNPEKHRDGAGYQTYQAMVALGSGGPTGLGLGNGRQKLGFVPEHHTDFIFSVVGEELGLVATLAVLATYAAIVLCGLYIAWHASDLFGLGLAGGITCLLGLQAALNMGVVSGALPNKGLALPFLSYGGSNLVLMLGCVGLLLNVARHAAGAPRTLSTNPFAVPDELASQPS